jgi:phosphoribosyl 1,2-cyclic phosphodiesterase
MKVCVLASGSRGNAIWVKSSGGAVLFDAGISLRAILAGIDLMEEDPGEVKAVVISHEHMDHIKGLPVLVKKFGIPLFANSGTAGCLSLSNGKVRLRNFESGKPFQVAGLRVTAFPVPHDAADPVGFVVEDGRKRLGICTDLGTVTNVVRDRLSDCRALVLEANHDREMLDKGPYPYRLKHRIRSRHGHLENKDTAALLADLHHPGLEHVFLAHLSQVNNTPKLAHDSALSAIGSNHTSLHMTWQNRISDLIEI